MKFMKNAGIATGVTISMLALNIQGTKGLPDNAGQTVLTGDAESLNSDANTNPAAAESVIYNSQEPADHVLSDTMPEPPQTEEDSQLPDDGSQVPGDGDSQLPGDGSQVPGDGDSQLPGDGSQIPGDGDSQIPGDGSQLPGDGDSQIPGDGSQIPGDGDSQLPGDGSQIPGDGDSQIPGDGSQLPGDGSQLPGDGNSQLPGDDLQAPGDGTPQKPEDGSVNSPQSGPQTQETFRGWAGETYYDNSPNAIYIQHFYTASETFIDQRDKVKYNAALPIEGIPSFITQEMIIGALKCQDETGYPASVTIAQIIQESGFGVYGPDGVNGLGLSYLAYQYCNLFGVKGMGPAGSVDMRTGEMDGSGESYMTTAGFRVYNTYTESIEDRTKLLQEVYRDLTTGVTDSNTFAMRIGGRWATDIRYSQSLIQQMETYDLYRLDRMTLKDFSQMIGKFADPCPGSSISSTFGYRTFDNDFHKGLDLGTGSANIPTYAAEAGTVITAGFSESAGNWIVIDHGNGLVTKYMHHDKIYVGEGQRVEKGQQIGLSGSTGYSTGNHLHFQVEENGLAVDPTPYLGL